MDSFHKSNCIKELNKLINKVVLNDTGVLKAFIKEESSSQTQIQQIQEEHPAPENMTLKVNLFERFINCVCKMFNALINHLFKRDQDRGTGERRER